MIRFGSRVDVYLPEGTRPLVAEGQTAIAGETVIADLRAGDAGNRRSVSADGSRAEKLTPIPHHHGGADVERYIADMASSPFEPDRPARPAPPLPGDPGAHAAAQPHHAARALRRA